MVRAWRLHPSETKAMENSLHSLTHIHNTVSPLADALPLAAGQEGEALSPLIFRSEAESRASGASLFTLDSAELGLSFIGSGSLAKGRGPDCPSGERPSLKGNRAERGAGGVSRSRSGESEGRSPAVLLVKEQVAAEAEKDLKKLMKKMGDEAQEIRRKQIIGPQKPKSITACENHQWSMVTHKKKNPDSVKVSRFRCKSWRCTSCSPFVRNRDFVRIRETLKENPGQYFFAVFTVKREGRKQDAYKEMSRNFRALIKRLVRAYGKIDWIQTLEQHKDGWPHMNMLFKFQDERSWSNEDTERFRARWLVKNSLECGLGKMVSCEIVGSTEDDLGKISSYMAKTGLTIISAEVSKLSQVPTSAPKGTRRIRSSVGFLKPIAKNDSEYTGGIIQSSVTDIKRAYDSEGSEFVSSMIAKKLPAVENIRSYNFPDVSFTPANIISINNYAKKGLLSQLQDALRPVVFYSKVNDNRPRAFEESVAL